MRNASALRQQIEVSLSHRVPGALTVSARPLPEQTPCGVDAMDDLLHGGLPAGVITEFVGAECSGRTAMAMAYLAAITQEGGVCAWIDVADALAPESAAASGVDLERLLWVRCGADTQAPAYEVTEAANVQPQACAANPNSQPRQSGGGSPHPRSEGRDLPEAIGAMMVARGSEYDVQARREKKRIGTPGAPNRPVTSHPKEREEQVNSDRLPARRGENLAIPARCAEPQTRPAASISQDFDQHKTRSVTDSNLRRPAAAPKPWQALDQAMRTTDLLLQAGGFRAVVLDLASMAPDAVWRIPMATWFRYRAACDRSRTSLLLLSQHSCACSSAELVVRLGTGSFEADDKVVTRIRCQAAVDRDRKQERHNRVVSIRKPPASERHSGWSDGLNAGWKAVAPWARVVS